MLERLVYQSSAAQDFGSLGLFKLLTEAQARNHSLQITGHLLFINGQFTQCIEGPSQNIELLWQSLQRDPRHESVQLLLRRPTEERRFPQWTMAFSTYSSLYVHGMKGFFPVQDGQPSPLVELCAAD